VLVFNRIGWFGMKYSPAKLVGVVLSKNYRKKHHMTGWNRLDMEVQTSTWLDLWQHL
jgi:hypothetical protein